MLTDNKTKQDQTEKETTVYYKANMDNKLDSQLMYGLLQIGVRRNVTCEFVQFIRLFQFVHKCLNQFATINSIVDDVKFNALNGSKFPDHYISVRGIREIVDCLGLAQNKADFIHIAASQFISICEDAQLVQKISARGFIVNCWDDHTAWHLFVAFENMNKNNDFPELLTIDTGSDATKAILTMIQQIGKEPHALVSFCGDGDGTNTGHINGVKGQVRKRVLTCTLLLSVFD